MQIKRGNEAGLVLIAVVLIFAVLMAFNAYMLVSKYNSEDSQRYIEMVERYGEYVIDPDTGLRVYIQSSD